MTGGGERKRVHDMGGEADGPVLPEDQSALVFSAPWHGRALAITLLAAAHGKWNLDASRHARETLPAEDYRRFSYYEKWMAGLANLLVRHDLVTADDLLGWEEVVLNPLKDTALRADQVAAVLAKGGPTRRRAEKTPRFSPGDRVQAKTPDQTARVKDGHTRLPGYIAGKSGTVLLCHGSHVLPDSNAHFLGEAPEMLYAIEFSAADLWGRGAGERDSVIVDCWESYLE
ncbi:nitrile hydratase subunit beta [Alphaproteobacteria bacterium LSUCC0684]